jgi:hypothetical protein
MERVLEREGELSLLQERLSDQVTFLVDACESLSVPVPLGPLRELAESAGDLDLADPGRSDRLVLARRLLASLTDHALAVAVVEDAHWADPSTLDVLRLLVRRLERAPVMLVATYRDDEVAANPGSSRSSPRAERRSTTRPPVHPTPRSSSTWCGSTTWSCSRPQSTHDTSYRRSEQRWVARGAVRHGRSPAQTTR